jgi:hypothetical protein
MKLGLVRVLVAPAAGRAGENGLANLIYPVSVLRGKRLRRTAARPSQRANKTGSHDKRICYDVLEAPAAGGAGSGGVAERPTSRRTQCQISLQLSIQLNGYVAAEATTCRTCEKAAKSLILTGVPRTFGTNRPPHYLARRERSTPSKPATRTWLPRQLHFKTLH